MLIPYKCKFFPSLISLFLSFICRKWMMMPVSMIKCCGPFTWAALMTWSSSWPQHRVSSSGVCMCWKSSPLCSETRLDRKIHFGSAHLNVLAVLCFSGFCYFCCCCCFLSLQTPEALVSAGHARSAEEKKKDSNELEALRQKEHAEKHSRTLQRGTRCRHTDVL